MNIEKNLAKDDYFPLRVKSIANQEQACHWVIWHSSDGYCSAIIL